MSLPKEQMSSADQLRDAITALEPDVRTPTISATYVDSKVSKVTLEEQHTDVFAFELTLAVPLDIRVHFETARNLYLYAWFVYRFYPVAEKHALATLEFALRERLVLTFSAQFDPAQRPSGLSALLRKARGEKLISNRGLRASLRWAMQKARARVSDEAMLQLIETSAESVEFDYDSAQPEPQDYSDDALSVFIQTLPKIRNTYAHGSSMLHSSVLGTFEIVTDLVNELYPDESILKT